MTRREQTHMIRYAHDHNYTVWGTHNEQSNSYGLTLAPPMIIFWDAASLKEYIDDHQRETDAAKERTQ